MSSSVRSLLNVLEDTLVGTYDKFWILKGARQGSRGANIVFQQLLEKLENGCEDLGVETVNDDEQTWCLKRIEYADDL